MKPEELILFVRSVLAQGASIHQDYMGGVKFPNYESYSKRIDAAARERAEELAAKLENESIRNALGLIMRYPNIRDYIGSQLSEVADSALGASE